LKWDHERRNNSQGLRPQVRWEVAVDESEIAVLLKRFLSKLGPPRVLAAAIAKVNPFTNRLMFTASETADILWISRKSV
jgi:hypothetical protein